MQVVNIRQLKNNPSTALRQAKQDLMMVTNRDRPDALLVSMEQLAGAPNIQQVRLVMAIRLFREKQLSVAAAARFAGKPLSEMLTLLSEMEMPVVDYDDNEQQAEAALIEKMTANIVPRPTLNAL